MVDKTFDLFYKQVIRICNRNTTLKHKHKVNLDLRVDLLMYTKHTLKPKTSNFHKTI